MMKTNRQWYWGIFFVLAAVVVVISQLGLLTVPLVNVIITLFLIPIFITSVIKVNFFGMLFSVALGLIVNGKVLGITQVGSWTILVAALLASIGLSLLFKRNRFHNNHNWNQNNNYQYNNAANKTYVEHKVSGTTENTDNDVVQHKVSFSSSTQYIKSPNFKQADFSASFGALKVFFDGASLSPEGAHVNLDISFAGVELYIPKEWKVENNISATLGGVDEKNRHYVNEGPVLYLEGNVSFGGIEIVYI